LSYFEIVITEFHFREKEDDLSKNFVLDIPISDIASLHGKLNDLIFAIVHVRPAGGMESKDAGDENETSEVIILKPEVPLPFMIKDANLPENFKIFFSRVSVSSHCVIGLGSVWDINDIFGIESKNKHHNRQQKRRLSNHSMEIADDCSICLTEVKNVILLPCRHCCVCHQCFEKIDKCPVCRSQFTSFIRYQKDFIPNSSGQAVSAKLL
jgi:hypothetical protein